MSSNLVGRPSVPGMGAANTAPIPVSIEYKSCMCIRGDHLNCPLPMTLEAYWNCSADCLHCISRRLNKVWGQEQRAANPEVVRETLDKALQAKAPKTILGQALKAKKAMWIGRKSDPYQPDELRMKVTQRLVQILKKRDWPFVLHSRFLSNALRDEALLLSADHLCTMLVEVTPGGESDWELFERKRTTSPGCRLRIARRWQRKGMYVGVRGEPFIPGYHTPAQFRDMCKRLKSHDLRSYNTYNLHMNEYTLKRLHEAGLDIERIWEHNQDRLWRPIQQELCQIAKEEDIILGCPDFVNVPKDWRARTTTCCGVSVPNAFKFNTHYWRRLIQRGKTPEEVWQETWEGIGTEEDKARAQVILTGKSKDFYTMEDAGICSTELDPKS